jgi:hypothetical protein
VDGSWRECPWDEDKVDHEADEPTLEAFDFVDPADDSDAEDAEPAMLFTVTNPPGTVSVTVTADGGPMQIDLAPRVVDMTESQLAEEISLMATLAGQNALAGQHVLISGIMRRLGHDRLSVQSYLEHELGLPSAETVLAAKAEIFAARYLDEAER